MVYEDDVINFIFDILKDVNLTKSKYERNPDLENSNSRELVVNTINQNTDYADDLQMTSMVVNVNIYVPKKIKMIDSFETSAYGKEIHDLIHQYNGKTDRVNSYTLTPYPAYTRSVDEKTSVTNIRINGFFT